MTPVTAFGPDLEAVGHAVSGRLRAVAAAVRRLDGLDLHGPDAEASGPGIDDVREVVLRLLRLVGDPGSDQILRAVAEGTGSVPALAALVGRPRVAMWEAVSDLVQAGLLERDPSRDGVTLTGAGGATLALVDRLVVAGGSRP